MGPMLPEVPDGLKFIQQFLLRAAELKTKNPVMAYYCSFYAANVALKRGYPRSDENDAFMSTLIDGLGTVLGGCGQRLC